MAATYLEVKAKAEELFKHAEKLRVAEVHAVIADIRARMAEYGITTNDLQQPVTRRRRRARSAPAAGKKAATPKRSAGKPKYRNPETSATWTGWGKPPNWIKEADAAGKSRDGFLIGRGRKTKRG